MKRYRLILQRLRARLLRRQRPQRHGAAPASGPPLPLLAPLEPRLLLSSVSGLVFADLDADGLRDSGESGRSNITVFLDQNGNGRRDDAVLQPALERAAGDVPLDIPDPGTLVAALAVSDLRGTITDLNLQLDIAHSFDSDLRLTLISPSGAQVSLADSIGGSGSDFTSTIFDDQANSAITAGSAPFTGSFRPLSPLAAVHGEDPNGTWILQVDDQAALDTGTLLGWSLTFTLLAAEPAALSDDQGAYFIDDLTAGAYQLLAQAPAGDVLSTEPVGQWISLENDQDFLANDIGITLPPGIRGSVFHDRNANSTLDGADISFPGVTVFLDSNDNGQLDTQTLLFSAEDLPLDIPDLGMVESSLSVADLPAGISHLTVGLDIAHLYVGDLTATLVAPDGTPVLLLSRVGGDGDDFVATILDDWATVAISAIDDSAAPFSDAYRPAEELDSLLSHELIGTWTLQVSDAAELDRGTLLGWSLTFTAPAEPIAISDDAGDFAFTDLPANDYRLRQITPATAQPTFPLPDNSYLVHLADDQRVEGLAFGNALPGAITGIAFTDSNGNGQQDEDDQPLPGITVFLDGNGNGVPDRLEVADPVAFAAAGLPQAIADRSTLTWPVDVQDLPAGSYDLDVAVDLAHTFDADLVLTLITPAGERILLADRVGSSGDNFTGTLFDEQSADDLSAAEAPFTGRFRPAEPLLDLFQQNPAGQWLLEVTDEAGGDSGELLGFSLIFTALYLEPSATTDGSGAYRFETLPPGDYLPTQILARQQMQTLPASPDGSAVAYELALLGGEELSANFASRSSLGSVSGTVILDGNGDGQLGSDETALADVAFFLDTNGNGLYDAASDTGGYFATHEPLPLNDRDISSSALAVSALAQNVRDLTVTLDLDHTYLGDLTATLISPAGTRITLFSAAAGSSTDGLHNVTFDDRAAVSLDDATLPFVGRFQPLSPLAQLIDEPADGIWMLEIADDAGGDSGTLRSWALDINGGGEPFALSDAAGQFNFPRLLAGDYQLLPVPDPQVQFLAPEGLALHLPLGDAIADLTIAAQLRRAVTGRIFSDENRSTLFDAGDAPRGGVTVFADLNGNGAFDDVGGDSSAAWVSEDTPADIPDFGQDPLYSTINVSGMPALLTGIEISLDIRHTFSSDLTIYLYSPGGTWIELVDDTGGSGDDFAATVLTDAAARALTEASAPFTGRYRPAQPLSDLLGEDPNGLWYLEITDTVAGDIGTLDSWSLTLTAGSEPSAVSDDQGHFELSDLPPGQYDVLPQIEESQQLLYPAGGAFAADLGVARVLTANFALAPPAAGTSTITGSAFSDFNRNGVPDRVDRREIGRLIYLDLDRDGQLARSTLELTSRSSRAVLPDAAVITSSLLYAAGGSVLLDLEVFLDITHSFVSDLDLYLTSPAGTTIKLLSDVGGTGDDFRNTTISDAADAPIGHAAAPFAGSFRPEAALARFFGEDPTGVWTLTAIDDFELDQGELNHWSLALTVAAEPVIRTDEDGAYSFTNLPAGEYSIGQELPAPLQQTYPAQGPQIVELTEGDTGYADFGAAAPPSQISGIWWLDSNGDGLRSGGEPAVDGQRIDLIDADSGQVIRSQFTHSVTEASPLPGVLGAVSHGVYQFDDVPAGNYLLRADNGPNLVATAPVPAFQGAAPTTFFGRAVTTGVDFPTVQMQAGTFPRAVTLGDFNGDGSSDLAVANAFSDDVSVFLNYPPYDAAQPPLYLYDTVAAGHRPQAITSADVDGDGDLDLLILNARRTTAADSSGAVTILTNDGEGNFTRFDQLPVGEQPVAIIASDLDNDGDVDIAVANFTDGSLTIVDNELDPQAGPNSLFFSTRTLSVFPGDGFSSLAALDLQGDGQLELALTSVNDSRMLIVASAGNDGQAATILESLTVGPGAIAVHSGDLDGDGRDDLAVASIQSSTITVLLRQDDQSFLSVGQFYAGFFPIDFAISDASGDGRPDLMVVNSEFDPFYGVDYDSVRALGDRPPGMSVLLNQSDGRFSAPVSFVTGDGPTALAVGDLTGDGVPDVASVDGDKVTILAGHSGQYAFTIEVGVSYSGLNFAAAPGGTMQGQVFLDSRGDGRLNSAAGRDGVWVSLFDQNQRLLDEQLTAPRDLNGDGWIDPQREAGAYRFTGLLPGIYSVQAQAGPGFVNVPHTTALPLSPAISFSAGSAPAAILLRDLNGDEVVDLLVANDFAADADEPAALTFFPGNGSGRFSHSRSTASGAGKPIIAMATGRFTGQQEQIILLSRSGDLLLLSADQLAAGSSLDDAQAIAVLDEESFDNEQTSQFAALLALHFHDPLRTDLAIADFANGRVILLSSDGTDEVQRQQFELGADPDAPLAHAPAPLALAAGDLNGDGLDDLAVADFANDLVTIFSSSDKGQAPLRVSLGRRGQSGLFPAALALADVNGDGRLDLLTANLGDSSVSVLLNRGQGDFVLDRQYSVAAGPRQLIVGDVDGDGRVDVISSSDSGNDTTILRGVGGGRFEATAVNAPGGASAVALGDLDGDERPDLLLASRAAGTVAILHNRPEQVNVTLAPSSISTPIMRIDFAQTNALPDLAISLPANAALRTPLSAGGRLTVPVQISNVGSAAARGLVSLSFFAATGSDLAAANGLLLGIEKDIDLDLAAGDQTSLTTQLVLPDDLPAGSFLVITLSPEDALAEAQSGNNILTALPDLTVAFPTNTADELTPGQRLSVPVVLSNLGASAFSGPVTLRLLASSDDQPDAGDVELSTTTIAMLRLAAGTRRLVNFGGNVPVDLPNGAYRLIAVADAGATMQTDVAPDLAVSLPLTVAQRFGRSAGRGSSTLLTRIDGVLTRLTLQGPGEGRLAESDAGFELIITGSDRRTRVTIEPQDGAAITLQRILIGGSLASLRAPQVSLRGGLQALGALLELHLADVTGPAVLRIGSDARGGAGASVRLGHLVDVGIDSQIPLRLLQVQSWGNVDEIQEVIVTPALFRLDVAGDFSPSLSLGIQRGGSAPPRGVLLASATIAGQVSGWWEIAGSAGTIRAGSVSANALMQVNGRLARLQVHGQAGGRLGAGAIGAIVIGGDLRDALYMAGADLAVSPQVFRGGSIQSVRIAGSMASAIIACGVDPVTAFVGDDDDQFVDPQHSQLGSLRVGGEVDDQSLIAGRLGRIQLAGQLLTLLELQADERFRLAQDI